MSKIAIELTAQAEAAQLAALAAWVNHEEQRLALLVTAGCSRDEARACMRSDWSN